MVGPDAVDAYERLRAAVLKAEPSVGSGLHIIRRWGLAAWIRQCAVQPYAAAVRPDHRPASSTTHDPSPGTSDLTRLLAGIIVALATEPVHAHG
jgi:hypothetical protein